MADIFTPFPVPTEKLFILKHAVNEGTDYVSKEHLLWLGIGLCAVVVGASCYVSYHNNIIKRNILLQKENNNLNMKYKSERLRRAIKNTV